MDEDKIKQIVARRKKLEKSKLFVRRVITFSINLLFLAGGWVAIFFINFYSQEIQLYFAGFRLLTYIAPFVPSLCLSLVNGLIPVITKLIVKYEAWDFANVVIQQQVWRIYMAKMVNFSLYTVIQIELASGKTIFGSTPLITFNDGSSQFDCREDEAAINFFLLLITEYVLKLIYAPMLALMRLFGFGVILGRKHWKAEYVLSDDIVWLLYFQAILWVTQIFFPMITMVSPLLLYSLFRVNLFYLNKIKTKPKKSTNASDTGYFIMIFLNVTFFAIAALIVVFLAV
mmetsp:Transcript_27687/g.26702  ORF Transcript_27687/g.26702 Transcript_27687/m.26702 type:complete len:286 (+) Transcript_27687:1460-2317(+)